MIAPHRSLVKPFQVFFQFSRILRVDTPLKPFYSLLSFGISLFALTLAALPAARANDHIFPPAASAKPFVDFDRRGFLIRGKRTFLVSAGMEYARVPH